MNPIRELFVSYTRTGDETPILRLVEDREALETIKNGAPLFKRVGSIINVDSIDESHPIITIVCLTDKNLQAGEPEQITDEVINWLRDIGEMWT
jgi:hypothetical protein